jgi:acyl-CoA thioesterase I
MGLDGPTRQSTDRLWEDPNVGWVKELGRITLAAGLVLALMTAAKAADAVKIVMLGDSLTAGLGLPAGESLPAQLEAALKAKGHHVQVINAGVSGDTAADGLARLDWALDPEAKAVIVALGANDALRGLPPTATRAALDDILGTLSSRSLPTLVAGMAAPRNMGPEFAAAFDPIFADLSTKYGALYYPFLLDGVALVPGLNQADGIHPNRAGVAEIVKRLLPSVEALLAKVS